MASRFEEEIQKSRKILQNPYAHLSGEGSFSAVSCKNIKDVHTVRRMLKNQYAYLDEDGGYNEYPYYADDIASNSPLIIIDKINKEKIEGRRYSRGSIENLARKLQREMWFIRKGLFPTREEVGAMDILNPSLALDSLGYTVQAEESLGQCSTNGELFEVAGILDNKNNKVQISRRFSPVIRNFTTAHELGHAVLHEGTGLHRDRALDGSANSRSRDSKEAEADIFAAYFLLPEKQVRAAFKKIFLTQLFTIEENTAFALASSSLESLQDRCRTLRDLTRLLASTTRYNSIPVNSLANQFKVSIEVMAIRLEELHLVKM